MHVHGQITYDTPEGGTHSDVCAEGETVRRDGEYRADLHRVLDEALDRMDGGNASCFYVHNDAGEKFMPEDEDALKLDGKESMMIRRGLMNVVSELTGKANDARSRGDLSKSAIFLKMSREYLELVRKVKDASAN